MTEAYLDENFKSHITQSLSLSSIIAANTPPTPLFLVFLEAELLAFDFTLAGRTLVAVTQALVLDDDDEEEGFFTAFFPFCLCFVDHASLLASHRNAKDSSSSNHP